MNIHLRASHFVGYVEDGESIEMIMKKFETLEEFQKEKEEEKEKVILRSYGERRQAKEQRRRHPPSPNLRRKIWR